LLFHDLTTGRWSPDLHPEQRYQDAYLRS